MRINEPNGFLFSVFSAALPGQGGTNHTNEQWSWYWEELFAEQGFVRLDPVRPRVWRNPDVEWWYQQNTLLYAHPTALREHPKLVAEHRLTQDHPMELVSAPSCGAASPPPSLLKLIAMLSRTVWCGLSRRMWYRPGEPLDQA